MYWFYMLMHFYHLTLCYRGISHCHMSVRVSIHHTVSKQLNVGSRKQCHTIAQRL